MAVNVGDIATELGRSTPPTAQQEQQWSGWIERAYRTIARRAESLGRDMASLDAMLVDDVVIYVVARRASQPADGAESITEQASVDDGSVSETRRFGPKGYVDLFFLDQWWQMLGLSLPQSRIGSIRLGVPVWRTPRSGL